MSVRQVQLALQVQLDYPAQLVQLDQVVLAVSTEQVDLLVPQDLQVQFRAHLDLLDLVVLVVQANLVLVVLLVQLALAALAVQEHQDRVVLQALLARVVSMD